MSFSDVVEAIKALSHEEKQQIQLLLNLYLREERRDEMYENFMASKLEEKGGKIQFSSNIEELKQLIEE
jgi:hypothetical protein